MRELSRIFSLMEEKGIAHPRDLVGVPETEISQLESHFGLAFPDAYREFLITCGRSAGFLTPWMAVYFDDLKEIRELFHQFNATRDIETGTQFYLPDEVLLIANTESVFDFFRCDRGPNPPVIRIDFSARILRPKPIATSFTGYLEYLVNASDCTELPDDSLGEELEEDLINF